MRCHVCRAHTNARWLLAKELALLPSPSAGSSLAPQWSVVDQVTQVLTVLRVRLGAESTRLAAQSAESLGERRRLLGDGLDVRRRDGDGLRLGLPPVLALIGRVVGAVPDCLLPPRRGGVVLHPSQPERGEAALDCLHGRRAIGHDGREADSAVAVGLLPARQLRAEHTRGVLARGLEADADLVAQVLVADTPQWGDCDHGVPAAGGGAGHGEIRREVLGIGHRSLLSRFCPLPQHSERAMFGYACWGRVCE